jgi:hypothetical protein
VSLITGLALLAAGCGGGGGASTQTTERFSGEQVSGEGYSFVAPDGWTLKTTPRTGTASKDGEIVSVTVLPLLAAYKPALFPRVTEELDRVAKELASKLGGELTSSRTILAAGGKAREYRIEHDGQVDLITFVLRAKREYQLTCRWQRSQGEPSACDQLVGSFSFR